MAEHAYIRYMSCPIEGNYKDVLDFIGLMEDQISNYRHRLEFYVQIRKELDATVPTEDADPKLELPKKITLYPRDYLVRDDKGNMFAMGEGEFAWTYGRINRTHRELG